jgi:hypothetical protein
MLTFQGNQGFAFPSQAQGQGNQFASPFGGTPSVAGPALTGQGIASLSNRFAGGGLVKDAEKVAKAGRYGDTMLVHMNPDEVASMARQGKLTINPETGQPEAFIQALLPLLGGILGNWALPALGGSLAASLGSLAGPIGAGLGTLGGTMLGGGSIEEGLTSGLLSFGLGSILGPLFGDPASAATGALGGEAAAGGLGFDPSGAVVNNAASTLGSGFNPAMVGASLGQPAAQAALGAASPANLIAPGIASKAALAGLAPASAAAGLPTPAQVPATAPTAPTGIMGSLGETLSDPLTLGVGAMALGALPGARPPDSPPKDENIPESFPDPRTVVPAPAGYRPGFDPETHMFFEPLSFQAGGPVQSTPPWYRPAGTNISTGGIGAFGGIPDRIQPFLAAIAEKYAGQGATPATPAIPQTSPATPATPPTTATPAAGYRPGFDPQFNWFANRPPAPGSTGGGQTNDDRRGGDRSYRGATPNYRTGVLTAGLPTGKVRDNIEAKLSDHGFAAGGQVAAQPGAMPPGVMPPMSAVGQRGGNRANPFATGINAFQSIDPRQDSKAKSAIIQEAAMALAGKHPNPQPVITRFVTMFGPEALQQLKAKLSQASPSQGRFIQGPGTGQSDQVPARIDNGQEARLSDGEFVIPSDAVSGLGDGSSKAGAKRLQGMVDKVRKQKTGRTGRPKPVDGRVLPV